VCSFEININCGIFSGILWLHQITWQISGSNGAKARARSQRLATSGDVLSHLRSCGVFGLSYVEGFLQRVIFHWSISVCPSMGSRISPSLSPGVMKFVPPTGSNYVST
jgi:hypothetical protein